MGHRPGIKGGYFPVPPVDSAQDMRGEYLKALRDMGVKVEKHHHAGILSQHELGMYFGTLLIKPIMFNYINMLFKWLHTLLVRQLLMPKPVKGDNGSGMHCHQSIWKGNTPVFREKSMLVCQKKHYIT